MELLRLGFFIVCSAASASANTYVLTASLCDAGYEVATERLCKQAGQSGIVDNGITYSWYAFGGISSSSLPKGCIYNHDQSLHGGHPFIYWNGHATGSSGSAHGGRVCTGATPTTTTATTPGVRDVMCLQPFAEYDVSIYSDGGNKYAIGESSRPSDQVYGLTRGVYYFKIPDSHPMGIHSNGVQLNSNQLAYGASDGHAATTSNQNVEGVSTEFVAGVMKIEVKDDFGNLSVHCKTHGAMGGSDLLKFDTTCTPHMWVLQEHQMRMNQIEETPLST